MLPLVVAAADAGSALATHCINFINEDDAGRIFLGIVKHVSNPGRAHTDEHFNKIGTGNREKRNLGFTRNSLGEQSFASTRRADQQQATRNTSAKLLEFGGIFQKINHFLDFFLGFVAACNIGECHGIGRFVKHASF